MSSLKRKAMSPKQKLIGVAVLTYFGLLIPVSTMHELGHVTVCAAEGSDYRVGITARGMYMDCIADMEGNTAFFAMGGVFGLAGSLAIAGAGWKLVKNAGIIVAGLAFAVDHGIKIFLEGFWTSFYFTGVSDIVVTAIQIGALALFMQIFILSKKQA